MQLKLHKGIVSHFKIKIMKQLFLKLQYVFLYIAILIQANNYAQCDPTAPNIGVQAQAFSNITIIEGTSTTLSSPITGTSYQWTKDGTNIAGANTSTLLINNFSDTDVGDYTIIVDGVTLANTVTLGVINTSISAYEKDRLALIDLYNSTNGAAWTNNTNWLTGPIETWEGVTVTNCRVTKLVLQNNNLDGPLPTSFSDLTGLKYLTLKENNISGVLDISPMNSLLIINVTDNNFSDITFGTNNLLQRVHISNNPITPGKTIDLSAMRQLIDFRAPGMGLSQVVLTGDYNNLRYLFIQDNQLTGTLDMSNMPRLTISFAHNNQFSDFNLGVGADLQRFYFFNNPVTPGKSVNISTMRNLLDFRIQNLGVTNLITSGTYDKMLYYLIQDNQISGTYDISNMPNLRLSYAHNNQFTDFKLGNNAELARLYLYNNPIVPGKVMDISPMRKLLDFRVQGLGLSQLIMSGSYSNMYYFIIQDNDIIGELDLSTMSQLRLCYAKNNLYENLKLPSNFSDSSSELTHVNVRNNRLHFDDLIPYNSVFGTINFYYTPQRNVPTQVSGNTVSVNVGGGADYNWSPSGPNASSFTVTTNGTYSCEITNSTQVPGLIIQSDPVTVSAFAESSNRTKEISIQNSSDIGTLKTYPNPVPQGTPIHLELNLEESKSIYFSLYSIQGKKVKEFHQDGKEGMFTYQLDSSGLSPGTYILQSEFDNKKHNKTIIVK